MLKRKKISFITAVLGVAILGTAFTGCGKAEEKKAAGPKILRYNLGAEPKTIDPGLNNSVEGGTVDVNAFEGLINVDENNKVTEGVAEKWEISKDGLVYKFNLRKDAKWSDGKPVTAKDFQYAWLRALDPKTASEYATQLYYLKNGEAYNNSENPDWKGSKAKKEDVGIKVIDDNTLEVTLENPTAYFLSLLSFPTYMPIRQDMVEKDKEGWTRKSETYVSNGAFKLKEWKAKDSINFEKNTNYWNAKAIKLDGIEYKVIDTETSSLAGFNSGQIDATDFLPADEKQNLIKSGDAVLSPYLGTYYYSLNISPNAEKMDPNAKVLKDVKVRKALNLAINRKEIVENITKAGEVPATTFVPKGIVDSTKNEFKNKDYYKGEGDVAEAKKLLAEAGFPDGKGFPKLEVIYNNGQGHQNVAQAIQDMYKKNLGIDISLRNVERKVQLDNLNKKEYVMARSSWIADYNDPMTFLDLFLIKNGNNNSGYYKPEYDKLINAAKAEIDPAKRTAILHEAEDMIMNDMPIIPVYYYTNVTAIKKNVKNIEKSPLGFVYFRGTTME
ncbi:oligopeptide transport system substrate-binding protein [Clostridium cavendishii DSM 21758]|uniref:Oligopeptide transport system substrate-binding protein n=1 Tax=Clostridium cavendishii DSM 21758 TaxID=1121302 RepID=A0A1M6ICH1_9CLOT|nr:peptide ABC transporter substrate-binding protein [Clostridium cavendishii]SHJ32006.1 oligopeptide transport system substrate-binding protein [Clostridium cavendishii DSM 21758]